MHNLTVISISNGRFPLLDSNLPDDAEDTSNAKDTKDELSDILGSHFDLESIPNINSKDVEDIFKVSRNLQKVETHKTLKTHN